MIGSQSIYASFIQYLLPQCVRTLGELLGDAREDPRPDVVHDLRVSARRSLQMLGLIQGFLPYGASRATRRFLEGLVSEFSRLRNRDVFLDYLKKLSSRPEASIFLPALRHLRKREKRKRTRDAGRFKSFWKDPAAREGERVFSEINRLLPSSGTNGEVPRRLLAQMRRQCGICLEDVRARIPEIFSRSDDKTLHGFRVALRRLRYTCEALAHLWGIPSSSVMNRFKSWQADVGRIHDLDVFLKRVQKRYRRILQEGEDFELLRSLHALECYLAKARAPCLRKFLKDLRRDQGWFKTKRVEPDWGKLNAA